MGKIRSQRRCRLAVQELESRVVPAATLPRPDHIVIVIEENHDFTEIIGSANAPYINSLAAQGASMADSHGNIHPSQANYIDLFSGDPQGVVGDGIPSNPAPPFTTANLGAELRTAGFSFAGYSETLPATGSNVEFAGSNFSGNPNDFEYARKHNPWVNWQNDVNPTANQLPSSVNLPFTAFPTDFTQLPTVSFVIPNQYNDMHSALVNGDPDALKIQRGDTWLQNNLNNYVQWAKTHNSLLIFTFDENDFTESNHIPTLFVGPMVLPGSYNQNITHFNVLRTIEDMYGLTHAGAAATATPITSPWVTAAPLVVSAGPGGGPEVKVFNAATGALRFDFFAFSNFTGGTTVASGDIDGDKIPDIIVGQGPGATSLVRVFSGVDSHLLRSFNPYGTNFSGGIYVAAADVNGDGIADIITGPGANGGPEVKVFSGTNNALIYDFNAYASTFTGGVRVAGGDVNKDGKADVIVGPGTNGGPEVKIANGLDQALIYDFFAFSPSYLGGVFVAAGDLNGDGFCDIIMSQGLTANAQALAVSGINSAVIGPITPFAGSSANGIRVSTVDRDNDGQVDVIVSTGTGTASKVRSFKGPTLAQINEVSPYDPGFLGGVYVG